MADRYWVGGTANWDGTAGTKWATTSGGAGGASVPTTADDVFFDGGSGAVTCTIATGNTGAKSINCTGFTGTITGTAAISVAGSITLVAGQTYTHTGTVTLTGTGTLITAGKTFSGVRVDGAGITVTLGDALNTATRSLTIAQGTFDTSASNYSVTVWNISSSSGTRTITLNGSTVTLAGSFATLDFGNGTNLTFNAGTSTINCTGHNVQFDGGGKTFNNVSIGGSQNEGHTITGTNTFNNLTIVNRAFNGTNRLSLAANQTVTGTFTCNGTQTLPYRRYWIRSTVFGTNRTITAAAISIFGTDFRDITGAGAASWSDSSRTNYWGDAGGNSGITFATGRSAYWNLAGTQSWTANGWALTNNGTPAAANYPLVQDTAIFTEAGAVGTVQLNTQGLMIPTVTMADGVSNRTSAMTLNFGSFDIDNFFGSITFFSNLTISGGSNRAIRLSGYNNTQSITTAGKTLLTDFNLQESFNNTVQLQDNLTVDSGRAINVSTGTFDANGYNVSTGTFNGNVSSTRTITMGSGTWTLSGTGTVWNLATTTNLTFNKDTANIVLSNTTTTARTFAGGGLTYNNLTIGGATGTSTLTITGTNTFDTLASTKTVPHTINLNTTGQNITTWSVTGSAFPVSGFQNILRNSAYSTSAVDVDGYRMNYLVAPDSSISGTTPYYVASNNAIVATNMILVFRPNTTPSSVTVNSLNNYADAGVLTSPSDQTITSGAGTAPLVALALYEQGGGGSITTRSFSPTQDGEVNNGTTRYIKYKIYNSAPSDITVGMTSTTGTARGLASFYLQFNGTSSVSFVTSSTNGVVPTVQAGDIVVSFILAFDASSAIPILIPVIPTNTVIVKSASAGTARSIAITNKTIDIDYLRIQDITSPNLDPVTFYAGDNSINGGNNTGVAFIERTTESPQNAHILTSGTTFTVPSDWNSSNNNIYMIGAGGGGAGPVGSGNNRAAGGGGGGGAFTQLTNFTATPSSSITYAIGTSAANADGTATTWNSGAFIANGGLRGTSATTPTSAGGAGGTAQTVSGIITAAFAGGNGGAGGFGTSESLTGYGSGAGGGAGGPNGVGGNGGTGFGSTTQANIASGGGGGNGGGSNGGNASSATFGAGGNNFNGTGGGATNSAAGTFGGGGAGGVNTGGGGTGGSGIDILNTLGGAGGRGGSAFASPPSNTGLYGGGGPGGAIAVNGAVGGNAAGSQGVIFIVYTPVPTTNNNFFLLF